MKIVATIRPSARWCTNTNGRLRGSAASIFCFCAALIVAFLFGSPLQAQSSQLAATPPMGWNSWNHFAAAVTDADVRAAADAMVASGMRDAGYTYVNIDDGWEGDRDTDGTIRSNAKFPDMKALSDYVHAKGLKLGIYSSPGPKTCAGFAGSYEHEAQDAQTYATWGVDYLKYDLCSFRRMMLEQGHGDLKVESSLMENAYEKMHQAILTTGRPIVFSLCQYGMDASWEWAPMVGGNLWRTTTDISDNWSQMTVIGFAQAGLSKFAKPGHWNDPDMLEVGNGHMSADEYRVHMSLWAILAAPLLAGNDLSKMSPEAGMILMNREVIAIDQDPLGRQGDRVSALGPFEIWQRQLANGDLAVAMFNRGESANQITLKLADLGLPTTMRARELWNHSDFTIQGSYTPVIPKHGVVLLRLSRAAK
jgi:alpha-galactosidase